MATNTWVEIHSTRGPVSVVDPHSPLSLLVTRPAVTVAADATLAEAVEVMQAASVSALLVGAEVGIVTERDLARALGAGCAPTELVECVTTRHPIAVPGAMTAVAAAGLMLNEQVRHLLVEFDSGAIGVVSIRDLLAVLLQATDPHLWLTSLRVAIEEPSEIWLG